MTIQAVGTLIENRYRIVQLLGQGGFGAVYEAIDDRLGHRVALKQLLRLGDRISRQFEREARLLANLSHPALPRVTDHFSDANGQFLVMDFVPGRDLMEELLQRNAPFPLEQVLQWSAQLLDALQYLHTRQPPVIHRDIKPQNLKLRADGTIMLLDFGLAKGFAGDVAPPTTESSFLAYTKGYAPPEQVEGTGTDARSDLYSLASTLHSLLTNTAPPEAQIRMLAAARGRPDPLQPTHSLNPQVPVAVSHVLRQAMALEPDQRPASAHVMRAQLESAYGPLARPASSIAHPIQRGKPNTHEHDATLIHIEQRVAPISQPAPLPAVPPPPQQRSRPWFLPIGVVLVVLLLLIGGGFIFAALSRPGESFPAQVGQMVFPATETVAPTPILNTPTPALSAADSTSTTAARDAEVFKVLSTGTAGVVAATNTSLAQHMATAEAATQMAATQAAVAIQVAQGATSTAAAAAAAEATSVQAATDAAAAAQAAVNATVAQAAAETEAAQATAAQATARKTELAKPTAVPRPTRTPRPTSPPTDPPPVAFCKGGGQGSRFVGTCSRSNSGQVGQGACIQGRVIDKNGNLFQSILVQIDRGGNPRLEAANGNTSTYTKCGLGPGEWGVAISDFKRDGAIEYNSPQEQGAHQVRVQLSGADGELFIVNFQER